MACINENFNGDCDLYGVFDCNECCVDGVCACSDDPNPAESCPNYESDNICFNCGVDLNVDECECE